MRTRAMKTLGIKANIVGRRRQQDIRWTEECSQFSFSFLVPRSQLSKMDLCAAFGYIKCAEDAHQEKGPRCPS